MWYEGAQSEIDDIMGLDVEAWVILTFVATNVMLSGHWSWSGVGDSKTNGHLSKRVSCWHMLSLRRGMSSLVSFHAPPKFARDALEAAGSERSASGLHLNLLTSASKHILASFRAESVGRVTAEGVRKWFDMMQQTRDSRLFGQASRSIKEQFKYVLGEGARSVRFDSYGEKEHPYFNPEALFLRVAHMVYFYTKSNENGRPPSYKHATIEIGQKDMTKWEYVSGELLSTVLCIVPQHGLYHLTNAPENIPFAQINLPYQDLKGDIDRNGIPCVLKLHQSVVQSALATVHGISRRSGHPFMQAERREMSRLNYILSHMLNYNEELKKKLQKREKVRRHYIKGRIKAGKPYNASIRLGFQRDIFVMGHYSSHFFHFVNATGRNAQMLSPLGTLL